MGDEVIQVYFSPLRPDENSPLQSLVAFKRVSVKKGETKTVELEIPVSSLRHFDARQNKYVVEKGKYNFLVGASSKDIRRTIPVVVK